METFLNKDTNFFESMYFNSLPNEEKLELYDNRIIQLHETLNSAERNPYSRLSKELKYNFTEELKSLQFKRKLLFDRMSVTGNKSFSSSQNNLIDTDNKLPNNQTFINSQIHFGEGHNLQNNKKTFISNKKWYEKPLGIIIITVTAGIIIGWLLYLFRWN